MKRLLKRDLTAQLYDAETTRRRQLGRENLIPLTYVRVGCGADTVNSFLKFYAWQFEASDVLCTLCLRRKSFQRCLEFSLLLGALCVISKDRDRRTVELLNLFPEDHIKLSQSWQSRDDVDLENVQRTIFWKTILPCFSIN